MDPITFFQKVYGRLISRELFSFCPQYFNAEGLVPDALRERQKRLGMRFSTRLFSKRYPGLPGRLHMHDGMLENEAPENLAHYIAVGQSALRNVEAALAAAGRSLEDLGPCLDMACGYGRVLRWLAPRVPQGRFTASEVMEEAIRFCHEEFGATPLLSTFDLKNMRLPETYDFIWVGSLFTHLTPADFDAFLVTLGAALNPRGVLVFSTQGPSCLEHLAIYGQRFVDQKDAFRRDLEMRGIAYGHYFDNAPDYGITFNAPEYCDGVFERAFGGAVRRVYYAERGWDNHQDVLGFQRGKGVGVQCAEDS